MGTPRDLVSRREAARLLRVTPRTVTSMVKQGLLKPVWKERKVYYPRADILAISQLFDGKTDFVSIRNLALRAFVRAEEAEKKVYEICSLLGLTTHFIETDEQSILQLYTEVKAALKVDPPVNAVEVMALAKRFLALTEEYFRLVEHYTCDEEPWRPYLEAVQHFTLKKPMKYIEADPELGAAYGYIEAARRHLRAVSYFYVHTRDGGDAANSAFIGEHFSDDLIATLFPQN